MVDITASSFKTLINDAGIADATAESLIDQAVHLLNLYGADDIPTMTGTAGSKTLSVTSQQAGAIQLVAREMYDELFKGKEITTVQGISVSTPAVLGNPTILQAIKEAARQLSEFDVDYG